MAAVSKQASYTARLRYWLENLLAQGTLAQVGILSLFSGCVVLLAVMVVVRWEVHPLGQPALGFWDALWIAMAHVLDGGTMGNDTSGAEFRGIMFTLTLLGLLVVSSLIGLLTTGLVGKLDELRRGRSTVMERDHTLVLGWSPAVFTIVSELVVANEHRRRPAIVILADRDKLAMEDELRAKVPRRGNTRVICRTGSPIDLDDLAIVSPNDARSIIILGPDGEDGDTQVIKTILALVNGPDRKAEPYHIVAEIREPKKREVAQLVGGSEVEVILASEVITRLTVQTCFQSGLSNVYQELFDFDGDEIYLHEEPLLVGHTFQEALNAFERSSVIGVRYVDGRIELNPPMATVLQGGDKLFAIARDQKSVQLTQLAAPPVDEAVIVAGERKGKPGPRRTLILAWNHRVPFIIREMDYYVEAGSEVTVVADLAEPEQVLKNLEPFLHNQKVSFWRGDTTDRNILEALDLYTYHHVIVMGYSEHLGLEEADARTLVTLIYLRDLVEASRAKVSIVTEMLNVRNRELARVTKVDDFIVSTKLVSLIMSQVSENKHLNAVFADLLDAEGQEIYLKYAEDYVKTSAPVNFYTVVAAAAQRGEVALGYRRLAPEFRGGPMDGVVVNPDKAHMVALRPDDRIIVLAEGGA
ncbi:MAG: Potassium transporter TrkA [Cyanobacteria bacterium RYN_339]|nr:Potassium transporter TrkA [Cyanobacteria bacterium RYN_339]